METSDSSNNQRTILLTGSTGYIGGRLLPILENLGYPIRCITRNPGKLNNKTRPGTEVLEADLLNPNSLAEAFEGVTDAYYLVHSMTSSGSFEQKDRMSAHNFVKAAKQNNVQRIIYLGGLGKSGDLSPHLASRQEVGKILRDSGILTIEIRASIILGTGSISFQMVRTLTNRLPIMVTPSWVNTKTQPIAIDDVVKYLTSALETQFEESTILEIGGSDQVSYSDIMHEYARQQKMKRVLIPIPILSPKLSSYWLKLITPLYANVGRNLIEGVRNETIVTNNLAERTFPEIHPMGIRQAIAKAIQGEAKA